MIDSALRHIRNGNSFGVPDPVGLIIPQVMGEGGLDVIKIATQR
jgi:hypothetical protein